ncbi:MAG TPA: FHA domain-containing protein [Polyangiaceae bacterium]|nr:FHA domain-containing protein [Polyangiaceae bacterium]
MIRYRLRFLLQEIDLPQGETVLGRSTVCHVTIEDPLVSRQHARLRVDGERATIEDLGSRNGLHVNGRPISGPVELDDNDRIRIGTQELVICKVALTSSGSRSGSRPTGFMCHCAACGLPYPTELIMCPSCGCRERSDEETISGFSGEDASRNWTLELLVDVIRKAQSLERWDDLERMMRRGKANVDERTAAAQPVDQEHLEVLAGAATQLAVVRGDAEWGGWALNMFAALGRVPPDALTAWLTALPAVDRSALLPLARRVVERVRAAGGPAPEERDGFARVESLTKAAPGHPA